MAWYNAAWLYRQKITIDQTKVAADETDFAFPFLVTNAANEIFGKARADGFDILFTSSDGTTKIDHERIRYNDAGGSEYLLCWVEVPSLSGSVDTDLYVYYGNAAASDQQNKNGTWKAAFKGVWHLEEEQSGTGNTDLYQDSTVNVNHGDDYISDTGQSGKVDKGKTFDGVDDYIDIPADASLGLQTFTISFWLYYIGHPSEPKHIISNLGDPNRRIRVYYDTQKLLSSWSDGDNISNANLLVNDWNYCVYTVDVVADSHQFFINGSASTAVTGDNVLDLDGDNTLTRLGVYGAGQWEALNGGLDEFRIHNEVLSQNTITSTYNSQNSPATFFSLSAEEQATATYTKTATADFIAQLTSTKTATADFIAKATLTKTTTADFIAQLTSTKTATADFIAKATLTKTTTADFIAQLTSTKTATADFIASSGVVVTEYTISVLCDMIVNRVISRLDRDSIFSKDYFQVAILKNYQSVQTSKNFRQVTITKKEGSTQVNKNWREVILS